MAVDDDGDEGNITVSMSSATEPEMNEWLGKTNTTGIASLVLKVMHPTWKHWHNSRDQERR